jgi:two-component system, NarL family, nitrate/nitrite response regulator NarL
MIRVLILGRTRLYCDALAVALDAGGRVATVAALSDVEQALASVRQLHPDVMLVDQPLSQAHRVVRSAQRARPGTKVIAVAVPPAEPEILGWAEAGAAGCLTQETPLEDLPAFIEAVQRGEAACSNGAAALLFRHAKIVTTAAARGGGGGVELTRREVEVLQLLAAGLSNKEIGRMLSIQVPTVKNHVRSIFAKLRIRNRSQAAAWTHVMEWGTSPSVAQRTGA